MTTLHNVTDRLEQLLADDDRPAETPHPDFVPRGLEAMSTTDVDAWIAATRNPKRDVIATVRAVVMSDGRIEEAVKYRAPAFLHGGIMAHGRVATVVKSLARVVSRASTADRADRRGHILARRSHREGEQRPPAGDSAVRPS